MSKANSTSGKDSLPGGQGGFLTMSLHGMLFDASSYKNSNPIDENPIL